MTDSIKVNGIVISSAPIGEYDRRLEILTDDMGRISAFARAARRPKSPLLACSQTFALGVFELYQGKSSYSLNSAEIHEYFKELTTDFEANCYGSYFLEAARYFTQENLEAEETLELLYYSLKALISDKFSNKLVKAIFELKLIHINGIYRSPKKGDVSEACRYAMDFVTENPIGKIYSFKLDEDIEKEFASTMQKMMDRMVDRKFKSLSMLNDI